MLLRRILTLVLAAVIGFGALVFGASSANAELYRYWSAWDRQDGAWTFVEGDPSAVIPKNGAVNGWRFGVGGVDEESARPPRSSASFAEICGTASPGAESKRVAVIIDTGTPDDAPPGVIPPRPVAVCATVARSANSVQVLQSVSNTRLDAGLVCGVENYPPTGCGDFVGDATGVPTDTPTEFALPSEEVEPVPENNAPETPVALVAVTAVAVVIAVAGVVIARNRRR